MTGRFLTDPNPRVKAPEHYCLGVEHVGKVPNGTLWACDFCGAVWRFSYMELFRSWGWKKLSERKAKRVVAA